MLKKMMNKPIFFISARNTALAIGVVSATLQMSLASEVPDFTKEKTLYTVPYSHLDTQWRWTYVTTVDEFIKNTIDENLERFEQFDGEDYVFTFTGSSRFEMMKEYYPEGYEKVKQLIQDGRWHVGGSSVDENDVNIPSPESMLRQILYGNRYFKKEFGRESVDYLLPDCFGFPAATPSILAHAGLKGFSTQKLTWGYPHEIPFSVGHWVGPDGKGVIAALDATKYVGDVKPRFDLDDAWLKRIDKVGEQSGYFVDYRYFGVGDRGGAPREDDVRRALDSVDNPDSKFRVRIASSDQMFRDLPEDAAEKMKTFQGDLLMKEHSAGSLTSQAYMKRWNRKNEQLADAAEKAAVMAGIVGGMDYPSERLEEAWVRILASQMHDIMPGTSLPECYEFSWNDEVIALNQFSGVLEEAAREVVNALDTRGKGVPLTVYNPLSFFRRGMVEAIVDFPSGVPEAVSITAPDGTVLPAQILEADTKCAKIAFVAPVKPLSWSVFDVQGGKSAPGGLKISDSSLENEYYRVSIDRNGDVASIIDKKNGNREMLSGPAQIHFQYHKPQKFPAWNMDWVDQSKPPQDVLAGPVDVRIVENGPVRVALEVRRQGRNSVFVQQIRLAAGDAGKRVEFKTYIDWQGQECAVKAAFPLAVNNENATYNMGLGTVERPTNTENQYEVPHREWLDLTDSDGTYGVSILEDSKFGSDKPSDNMLRLTLLYTPAIRNTFMDQYSQDWGRHDITYALYGHSGSWRNGTEQQARALNQPLVAFQCDQHAGALNKSYSFADLSSDAIELRTIKKSEDGNAMIIRMQELHGEAQKNVAVTFAAPIGDAWEVDGQERRIGPADFKGDTLKLDFGKYGLRSYAVVLDKTGSDGGEVQSVPLNLAFDCDVISTDANRADGDMDGTGRTYPAETLPATLRWKGIDFNLGSGEAGKSNALSCKGQSISLPGGEYDRIVVLAAANKRTEGRFLIGDDAQEEITIGEWSGLVGQHDNRVWHKDFLEIDYKCKGEVVGLVPGYVHRDPIACFTHHRHNPDRNEAYRFAYIFAYEMNLPAGASKLTLPNDPSIKVFAVSVARLGGGVEPAQPLYDDFAHWEELTFRTPLGRIINSLLTPKAMVSIDKKAKWDDLSMGPPSKDDAISFNRGITVNYLTDTETMDSLFDANRVKKTANVVDGVVVLLNDGQAADKDKDMRKTCHFIGGARFGVSLKKPTKISRINTYSRNDGRLAEQNFTLWGSNAEVMPDSNFDNGKNTPWEYLAEIDTRELGKGGLHGSMVMAKDGGVLGPYRHLLWIDDGGTRYTEIDVIEAK